MLTEIPTSINGEQVESLLQNINNHRNEESIDLELPVNLTFTGFSALPSLFQFLITWKRLPNSGKLIIKAPDTLLPEYWTKDYYLLFASILAWDNDIVNKNGESLKNIIRPLNREFFNNFWKNNTEQIIKNDSVLFLFIDHIPNGLLPILYSNGKLRGESEFDNITDAIVDLALKKHGTLNKYIKQIQPSLNRILYESFDNTNNWATQSHTGKILSPSIRGIFAKFHELNRNQMNLLQDSLGFTTYLKELKIRNQERLGLINTFLEITIFDSGSGLAQVFSGKSNEFLSLEEEYDYVRKCLRKHNTSHTAVGTAYARGIGLHKIMSTLNDTGGFLKIRTGRMSLFRDFLNVKFFNPNNDKYNEALLDWDNNSSIPNIRPYADGTVISIVIPQIVSQ
ncbi:MAG TPA: hypothetical protein VIU12_02055 [Chryseolinea sp.]